MSAKDYIIIDGHQHVRYEHSSLSHKEMLARSTVFFEELNARRTVREFDAKPVPRNIIENLIKSASTAPSGAHKQPWTFCAVSNSTMKSKIRKAAEKEEKDNYEKRMSERWKDDLRPLATDMNKPFLEEAPWLIIVFKRIFEIDKAGQKHNNYYVNESIGIACGMLITAIHNAGLVTLTHTPSPMNFLADLLDRPSNERAFLLLPVGYPKDPVYIPDLDRKSLDQVAIFFE